LGYVSKWEPIEIPKSWHDEKCKCKHTRIVSLKEVEQGYFNNIDELIYYIS